MYKAMVVINLPIDFHPSFAPDGDMNIKAHKSKHKQTHKK